MSDYKIFGEITAQIVVSHFVQLQPEVKKK